MVSFQNPTDEVASGPEWPRQGFFNSAVIATREERSVGRDGH
jgi:hypothetical protein